MRGRCAPSTVAIVNGPSGENPMRSHLFRFLALGAIAVGSSACTVTTRTTPAYYSTSGSADIYVESAPPPTRVEYRSAQPGSGYIWVEGYWDWRGGRWDWVSGRWERERSGYVYVRPRYEVRGGRHVYVRGNWENRDRPQVRDHRDDGWNDGGSRPPPRGNDNRTPP